MVSPDTLLVPLSEHPVRPRAPGLQPAISLQRRQDTRSLGHATAPYATSLSIRGKDLVAAGRWKPRRDRARSCRRASARRSREPLEVRGPKVLRRSQRVAVQHPRHARLPADLRGPCFEPLISDRRTDRAVLYVYPRLGVHRRRRRGSQSRSNCCLSRASAKTGSCRGPFHLALRKVPAGVCPVSRIGHPCGNLHRAGLTGRPLAGVPSDLRCSRMRFGKRDAPAARGTAARP